MNSNTDKFDLSELLDFLESTIENPIALKLDHIQSLTEVIGLNIHLTTIVVNREIFTPDRLLINNCLVIFANVVKKTFFTDPQNAIYTVNYIITKFDSLISDYKTIIASLPPDENEDYIIHVTEVIRSLRLFIFDISPLSPQLTITNKLTFELPLYPQKKSVPKKLRYKAILDFIPDFNAILTKHNLTKNDKIKVINWITDASGEEGYKLICTEEQREVNRMILDEEYLEVLHKMNKNK